MPKKPGRSRWVKKKGVSKGKKTIPVNANDQINENPGPLHSEDEIEQAGEVISISDASQSPSNSERPASPQAGEDAEMDGPAKSPAVQQPPDSDAEMNSPPKSPAGPQQPGGDAEIAGAPHLPAAQQPGGDAEIAQVQHSPPQEQPADEILAPPAKKAKIASPEPDFSQPGTSKADFVPKKPSSEDSPEKFPVWWDHRPLLPDSDDEDVEPIDNAPPSPHELADEDDPRPPPFPLADILNEIFAIVVEEMDQNQEVPDQNREVPDQNQEVPVPPELEVDGVQPGELDEQPIIISDDEGFDQINDNQNEIDEQPIVHSDDEGFDEPVVAAVPVEQPNRVILADDILNQAVIDRRIRNIEEAARIANRDPRRRRRTYRMASRPREAVEHYIGPMNQRCENCRALFFEMERTQRGTYTKCCNDGRVSLEPLRDFPEKLKQLFRGANNNTILENNDHNPNDRSISGDFIRNIVRYNNLVAFASAQARHRELPGLGPYIYAIEGQLTFHYSNVNVDRDGDQRFGPVYILNPVDAADQRFQNAQRHFQVRRETLLILSQLLHDHNPYAQQYRLLFQEYERQALRAANLGIDIPNVYLEIVSRREGRRNREFDLPQSNEVAAVYRDNEDERPNHNLRVFARRVNDGLRTIHWTSEHCDPMAFPLLFPTGDFGWNRHIPLRRPYRRRRTVSLMEYYANRLAYRHDDNDDNSFDVFRYAGRLNQHYVVAAYLRVEASRLEYIRQNQRRLRADHYQGLVDYLHNRAQNENVPVGRMVILPSSHQGSPRSQVQRFQDAMAIASAVGYPTYFITMTCNPNWREIRENIPPNDHPTNHPMLVARVFKLKFDALMDEITKKHIFGIVKAFVTVIEFQKRGLPHAHILLTMENEDRLPDGPSIDRFVSAEIPDPDMEPELHRLVGTHHIHGPCGAHDPQSVCMVNGECSKHFPMYFYNETTIRERSVNYRRRVNRRHIQVTRRGRVFEVGNEFVVPYNPYLLLRYRAHINIEVVAGQMYYKYLYKYFFKANDQALLRIVDGEAIGVDYDEIRSWVSGRYMTPPEAAWHLLGFIMHLNSHVVYRLPVHLENEQNVVFGEGQEEERAAEPQHTMLTHWFEMNRLHPEARRHLYSEFPLHYTWDRRNHRWGERQRTTKPVVSRIHNVSISYGEVYYLRLLLLHVRGATSFGHLRTFNGREYPTFREACEARGLLHEDQEWRRALNEAAQTEMPHRIRRMFAYILVYGTVTNAPDLWTNFRDVMMDDYLNRHNLPEREAEIRALRTIQRILMVNGRRLNQFGLEEPEELADLNVAEDHIDVPAERQLGDQMVQNLNDEQRAVFDRVINAVDNEREPNRYFYVSGAAGTGKTYLYNALITLLNGRDDKVIAVAWTGLAAALLKNGRTVHSRFQLPVPLLEDSTSGITGQSRGADFLRQAKLLIWDEISMSTRVSLNIVDRTLRDLCGDERPFGGKCVVVGGDFKQCLPVVPGGDRGAIVAACVKMSRLWPIFEHIRLQTNVRVQRQEIEFVDWLNRLGNGTLPTLRYGEHNNIIQVPEPCVVPNLDALIDRVFGDMIAGNVPNAAILTPLNDTCLEINNRIVASIADAPERVYISADSIVTDDPEEAANFPPEVLNGMKPSGIPPHRLLLKVGIVVMLLRNLNVRENLCNGTRLVIRHLAVNYIRAEIINFDGTLSGTEVLIPRIDLISNAGGDLPVALRRRQIPVKPCYAMTINKAQGQTFDNVGIHLPLPVFEHGQLYVAFSRVRTAENVSICVEDTALQGRLVPNEETTYTKNIVYREVLDVERPN